MRLWSIHPKYLDSKGLVALWREGLLAQKVLAGKTKGYKSHPQLERFRKHPHPLLAIGQYLFFVHREAQRRGYCFDKKKILKKSFPLPNRICISKGQLMYEFAHLLKKLRIRQAAHSRCLTRIKKVEPHPFFDKSSNSV